MSTNSRRGFSSIPNRSLAANESRRDGRRQSAVQQVSGVAACVEPLESRTLLSVTYDTNNLHSFNQADGAYPEGDVALDSSRNLFGATNQGGTSGFGTVFEIVHGTTTLTTLANFNSQNGANPQGGVTLDTDGNLFGTTIRGGAAGYGTVFEIVHGTTAITTLASFNNTNGASPLGDVTLDSSGNLFGTTYEGGASGKGTVFEIVHGTTAITTLASFNNTNGASPQAGVTLDSSGNLFGTTTNGGAGNYGTVFEIVHGTTVVTTLASFNNANGAYPQGAVTLDSSGNLFGTTAQGGAGGYGTVFEILHGTAVITTLARFNNTNGTYPRAGVTLDSSGNLFGTTFQGAVSNSGGVSTGGTVFEIASGTTVITTLASFNSPNGTNPIAGVTLDSHGNLYGTAGNGGASGYGTVFELSPGPALLFFTTPPASTTAGSKLDSGTGVQVSVFYPSGDPVFDGTYGVSLTLTGGIFANGSQTAASVVNGVATFSNLVINAAGTYTLTASNGYTTVTSSPFTISPAAPGKLAFVQQPAAGGVGTAINPAVTVAVQDAFGNTVPGNTSAVTLTVSTGVFSTGGNSVTINAVNGIATFSNLINNKAGSYTLTASGSALSGVVSSSFNIFSLDNLSAFNLANGASSRAALSIDSSGNLFGTTYQGGAGGYGTVFEIARGATAITTLASFNYANGANPTTGVGVDSNGNLYGITANGGAGGYGTVFEIVRGSNTITTVASFTGANGANPSAGVTVYPGGVLFGTTDYGGASGFGTIFEFVPGTNTVTTLASFNSNFNGAHVGVTLDSSGNLFGTIANGANGFGAVFELVKGTTAITTFASFNNTNGANPQANVTFDSKGNLFGTTYQGGAGGYGTVFEIVQGTTAITTLASFNMANGAYPQGGVIVDSNGNLFGTTSQGGAGGFGTVFEIVHGTTTITTLANFNNINGANPRAGVTVGSLGDLFGTTYQGGPGGYGTVFELSAMPRALSFTAQPVSTIAGSTLGGGTGVQVSVLRPWGDVDTADSSTVTLTLINGTFAGGGRTATAMAVNGVATFPNLVINAPGVYGLTASDGNYNSVTSSFFTISVGAPVKLGFIQPPTGAVAGLAISPALTVAIQDALGNTVTSNTSAVTVMLDGGVFSTGANSITINAVSGIATFSNLIINNAGSYTITASDGSLTSAASNSFNVYLRDNLYALNSPNGAGPQSKLTRDSSGNLFGTTVDGGEYGKGTVFEIVQGTTVITTLASFNDANGAYPYGGVTLDSGGNLFGTTYQGGASGYGTVFEIVHGTNAITTLASFNGDNGRNPHAAVTLDASGDLFGTTPYGGTGGGYGTVFEIVYGSNTLTTLASFNNTNGNYPNASLTLDPGGNLFGTTSNGGKTGFGSVFEIVYGTSTITTLASFNNSNGAGPYAGVILDSSGNLFGTTTFGGTSGVGTVFEIVHGTTVITTLASFNGSHGSGPQSDLILDSSGNLFGTTEIGGTYGSGTVFEIIHGTTAITTLASFNSANGAYPMAGLALDSGGNLFGTTSQGGVVGFSRTGLGTVFEIVHGTNTITTLVSFNSDAGGLTLDSSGNLFGMTKFGGATGVGSVFEIVHGTTTATTIASFNGDNGAYPRAGVTLDSSGNLFGTTYQGGADNFGTVFEIVHGTNTITTLASFNNANGANPFAGVTLNSSGDVFGATYNGGASGLGTVFEIMHGTAAIITLGSFTGTNGANPNAAVALDSSGNLFGTTLNGGTSGNGTVFEIVYGTNAITTLFSSNTNKIAPYANVTLDSSGNLFGTTYSSAGSGSVAVFEIVHGTNAITNLATFSGAYTYSGVTLDTNGNIFGTTTGAVFEILHGSNAVASLAGFDPFNGAILQAGVTLDSNGNIFGTTQSGGPVTYGTIFELSPTPPTLSVTTPPTSAAPGNTINGATGIQVGVVYSWGNLNIADTSSVTLTLTGGTFADGSTTKTAATVNGVATFTNLVINSAGSYTLTATDSLLASTASASFVVTPPGVAVVASGGNDSIYLRKDMDGTHVDEWLNSPTPGTGTPTAIYLLTGAAALTIDGAGGNDQLTIDQSNGDLLAATNGISGVGGSISVKIICTGSNDTLSLDGTNKSITWNTGASAKTLYFAGVTSVEYQDSGGIDNVSVAGPIPLTFDMGPGGAALNVAAGANATVNFGSSNGDLTINGNGNTSLVFGSGNPTFQFVTTPVNPPPATKGAIAGTVFNDFNGDGKRESGDKPLEGHKLYIDSNRNGKPDAGAPTATTDAAGAYHFTGLTAGTYRVREVLPAGYRASAPSAGYLDVAITGGKTTAGKNFGQTCEAQISGVVFRDTNHDGKRETSEAGLAGWTVYLDLNHDGKLSTGDISVKTDASGRYTFVVAAGKYIVREVVKTGFTRTAPAAAAYTITLTSGQSAAANNFGNR